MTEEQYNELDRRLSRLESAITQVRESQNLETSELRQLTSELLSIAQLHQRGLRILQEESRQNREETRRIWEYLLGQQGNGRTDQTE